MSRIIYNCMSKLTLVSNWRMNLMTYEEQHVKNGSNGY